jgi:MFS family permease
VSRLSQQLTTLVRDEMRLAQAELTQKGKKAGLGAGLFGGAGVVALYGVGALVAAAIIALSLAVTAWLAAVIVAVVLFIVAGVLALVGKKEVSAATPALPQEAIAGLKTDVATVKESAHR